MDRAKKLFLKVGAVSGALLGTVIFFMMDFLFSDSLNHGWREAAVNDVNLFFSINVDSNSPLVYLVLLCTFILIVVVSSIMGMAFSLLYYRFFKMLNK